MTLKLTWNPMSDVEEMSKAFKAISDWDKNRMTVLLSLRKYIFDMEEGIRHADQSHEIEAAQVILANAQQALILLTTAEIDA